MALLLVSGRTRGPPYSWAWVVVVILVETGETALALDLDLDLDSDLIEGKLTTDVGGAPKRVCILLICSSRALDGQASVLHGENGVVLLYCSVV